MDWLKRHWDSIAVALGILIALAFGSTRVKALKRSAEMNHAVADAIETYGAGTNEELEEVQALRAQAHADIAKGNAVQKKTVQKLRKLERNRGSAKAGDLAGRIDAL